MNSSRREIGERILAIRKKLKLKQEEFGEKIGGKSKAAISKYENGETYPPIETLLVIADLADVSLEFVITGKEVINEPPKSEITYPLAETEKNALMTAESLIERFGLDNRFQVVEIHQQQPEGEEITEEEMQLLKAFRSLDQRRRDRLIEDAEDMVLARAQH
ncbi:MAG: helix-turn-helix domain-containing protein [Bacteroidota bacterium]